MKRFEVTLKRTVVEVATIVVERDEMPSLNEFQDIADVPMDTNWKPVSVLNPWASDITKLEEWVFRSNTIRDEYNGTLLYFAPSCRGTWVSLEALGDEDVRYSMLHPAPEKGWANGEWITLENAIKEFNNNA